MGNNNSALNLLSSEGGGVLTSIGSGDIMEKALAAGARGNIHSGAVFDSFRRGGAYRTQFNVGLDKPLGTPQFEYLRRAFDVSIIDRIIVNARRMQIRRLANIETPTSNSVGLTVRHRHWDDPIAATDTPQIQEREQDARALVKNYDRAFHQDLGAFLCAAVEDILVYDRLVIAKDRDFKGRVQRYWSLDPIYIRPVIEALKPLVQKKAKDERLPVEAVYNRLEYDSRMREQMLDQMSETVRASTGMDMDLTQAAYIQVIGNHQITGCWRQEEMDVYVTNPRNRVNYWGYGLSAFEMSLETTDMILSAWNFNKNLFNQEYPENLLLLGGGYDTESLKTFKARLKAAGRGQDKRLGILSAETDDNQSVASLANLVKLRDSPRDMAFMEMLTLAINMKCAAFSMHPTTINIREMAGGGGFSFQQSGSEEYKISQAQEQGFHSLVHMLCRFLTQSLISDFDDEMQIIPLHLEDEDDAKRAEILQRRDEMTVNEKRRAAGLPELPDDDERGGRLMSQIGSMIDGAIDSKRQMEMQMQMYQQQSQEEGGMEKSFSGGGDLVFEVDIEAQE